MMFSGPNPSQTYHDCYMRKRNTSRSLADPPTLLTDRGAYLNYLESQLERVSAALITAHSYDQRFSDMQTLTSSLEQRVTSNTTLVALSSQLIEDLKNNNDERIHTFTANIVNENKAIKVNQDFILEKMAILEGTLVDLVSSLQPVKERLSKLENDAITSQKLEADHYYEVSTKIDKDNTNINNKIDTITTTMNQNIASNYNDVVSKLDTIHTATNRKIDDNVNIINNKIDNHAKDTTEQFDNIKNTTNTINDTISVLKTLIQRNDEAIESNNSKISNFNNVINSKFQELANSSEIYLMDEVNKITRSTSQLVEEKFISEIDSLRRLNTQRFDQEKAEINRMYDQLETNTKRIVTQTCDDLIGEVFINKENLNLIRLEVNANTDINNELKTTIQQIIDAHNSSSNISNTKINEIFKSLDVINHNIDVNNSSSSSSVSALKDEMVTQFQSINNTFASFDQIQEKIVLNIANINNDINNINLNMGKNFESVTKDIQETLSIIEENKAQSDEKVSATEQRMVSIQDFKRFEKKIEENISRFFANTSESINTYNTTTSTSTSTVGISGNVRKRNDDIVNDSNTSTKSGTYKRVTLQTDADDNDDDDDSSNNVAQINAKHNALSLFLSEYKNDQVNMYIVIITYILITITLGGYDKEARIIGWVKVRKR